MVEPEFDPIKHRWGFITFRAHCSEPTVFEDFINIFLPILTTFKYYAFSIEKDDSPDRHIHCIFNLDPANGISRPEVAKMNQKFTNKFMKDFKKSLGIKQTDWNHAWKAVLVENTREDFLKILGYCIKDGDCRRRSIKNIPVAFLTQGIKFHVSTARIESSAVKNDIKIINSKNFHISCEEYAKKNNMSVYDFYLIPKMTYDRHSFQISARDLKKYEAELKLMNLEKFDENSEYIEPLLEFKKDGFEGDVYPDLLHYKNKCEEQKLRIEELEKELLKCRTAV